MQVDMPFFVLVNLKSTIQKKRLLDFEVFDKIIDIKVNRDKVSEFAINICK
jgi:hypothetical protein